MITNPIKIIVVFSVLGTINNVFYLQRRTTKWERRGLENYEFAICSYSSVITRYQVFIFCEHLVDLFQCWENVENVSNRFDIKAISWMLCLVKKTHRIEKGPLYIFEFRLLVFDVDTTSMQVVYTLLDK